MTDAAKLTRVLGGKWHGRYGLAYCPAHDNRRTPALSLSDGEANGRLERRWHHAIAPYHVIEARRLAILESWERERLPLLPRKKEWGADGG